MDPHLIDRPDKSGLRHRNAHTQRHRQRLLDANLFNPGDVALDIGCGTGKAARDVARIVTDGSVVGIDLSAQMIEMAEHLAEAEGLANVAFVQGDVQVHPFDSATFDVAISSFGAMFFDDAHAAFANIGRALGPGGQLALLTWQGMRNNEWLMTLREVFAMGRTLPFPPPAAPTPFSLADPGRVHTLLQRQATTASRSRRSTSLITSGTRSMTRSPSRERWASSGASRTS